MAFITVCCKSARSERGLSWLWVLLAAAWLGLAQAQAAPEVTSFQAERSEDGVVISAQLNFELPTVVEDVLGKGIPVFFAIEADVLRERWYWYDKKVCSGERRVRLAYLPLTRRWRLNVTSGGGGQDGTQGLALNQGFDTLVQALNAIKRVSGWAICDAGDAISEHKYRVNFRFRLDLTQLPRPFQIGALGQSEWDIEATAHGVLTPISAK